MFLAAFYQVRNMDKEITLRISSLILHVTTNNKILLLPITMLVHNPVHKNLRHWRRRPQWPRGRATRTSKAKATPTTLSQPPAGNPTNNNQCNNIQPALHHKRLKRLCRPGNTARITVSSCNIVKVQSHDTNNDTVAWFYSTRIVESHLLVGPLISRTGC